MSQLPSADEPAKPTPPEEQPLESITPFRRVQRRRDKIVEEIERNRRGEYSVPTWVLALILVVLIAGWAAIIIFS
jgi:hypothetical protein